jgi:hypothetical protein
MVLGAHTLQDGGWAPVEVQQNVAGVVL